MTADEWRQVFWALVVSFIFLCGVAFMLAVGN